MMLRSNQENHNIACGAMMAEGFFRGAILGTVWGSVANLELVENAILKEVNSSTKNDTMFNLAKRRCTVIGYSARGFAVFFASYSLGACLGEDLFAQRKNSPVSSFCGGFCGGFALSALATPVNLQFCLTTGLATGCIAGGVVFLQHSLVNNKYF